MTTEPTPQAPKTYDQTLRFWVIFVASTVAGIVFFFAVVQPYLDRTFAADREQLQNIVHSYGAQEASYGNNGLMYVKKNGVLHRCNQIDDSAITERKSLDCEGGVTLSFVRR